ncbi:acid phosphatase [Fragilaria crotonensis]|nr:acid phosphatase [Fragilaria crotonensis]
MGRGIAASLTIQCLSLFTSTTFVWAIPELVQVHVIARHGSRVALDKSSGQGVLETKTSAILTRFGEKQLYELGTWLRNRYAVADTLLGDYVAHEVHFESSRLERTVSSANILSMGLYPPENRAFEDSMLPSNIYPGIPVYMHDSHNDIYIQAYDKCPMYDNALEELYATDSWKQAEADSRTLLTQLAQVSHFKSYVNADGYVPLSDVWKAFDVIHMAKNECAASASSNTDSVYCEFNPLDDTAWAELQAITHKAELERYSNTTARDLIGANLLFEIHERMGGDVSKFAKAKSKSSSEEIGSSRKFHLYSAHYQTILSMFAALNISPPSNEVIPGFGAALIFELYNDPSTGAYDIYLLYKESNSSNDMTIRFPDGPCEGSVSCPLSSFTELLASMSYTSLNEWCLVCGNESADVCLEVKRRSHKAPSSDISRPSAPYSELPPIPIPTSQPPSAPPLSPTSNQQEETLPVDTACAATACSSNLMIAGLILGAFLGGIPVGVLLLTIHQKKMARKRRKQAMADLTDPDDLINVDYSDRMT